jgi:hypothetical protein
VQLEQFEDYLLALKHWLIILTFEQLGPDTQITLKELHVHSVNLNYYSVVYGIKPEE